MLSVPNVATPPTAVAAAVPARVPPPALVPIRTVMVPANPVSSCPWALSALTCTAGMMAVAACVALGWTVNTKRGAPEGVVPLLQAAARIDDRHAHQRCFGISSALRDFS